MSNIIFSEIPNSFNTSSSTITIYESHRLFSHINAQEILLISVFVYVNASFAYANSLCELGPTLIPYHRPLFQFQGKLLPRKCPHGHTPQATAGHRVTDRWAFTADPTCHPAVHHEGTPPELGQDSRLRSAHALTTYGRRWKVHGRPPLTGLPQRPGAHTDMWVSVRRRPHLSFGCHPAGPSLGLWPK